DWCFGGRLKSCKSTGPEPLITRILNRIFDPCYQRLPTYYNRQSHGQRRTTFFTIRGRHRSTVKLHEMPHDRQPQSKAAMLARARSIRLTEPFEYPRQKLRRHTWTTILDS